MKAMVLNKLGSILENKNPLQAAELPQPVPADNEVLVRVSRCGVCHTELDEIEGRTPPPHLPVVLGHEVIGRIESAGASANMHRIGQRVGIAWIFDSCGSCEHCQNGEENLCKDFKASGRDVNGGYAEYMTVPQECAFPIPDEFSDSEAAPLMCAGAVGYRSLKLTNLKNSQGLGLTGFGASAHLVLQTVKYKYPDSKIFVFARSEKERQFALELGAFWSGDTIDVPPEKLHSIIDTTPVWKPIVEALKNLRPGGRLVINAIRKEDTDKEYLLNLDYADHLWQEKEIKSAANVTKNDVREFLELAAASGIKPEYQEYDLEEAGRALLELKTRKIRGAKVLRIS